MKQIADLENNRKDIDLTNPKKLYMVARAFSSRIDILEEFISNNTRYNGTKVHSGKAVNGKDR